MNINIQNMQAFEDYATYSRKLKALDAKMVSRCLIHEPAKYHQLREEYDKTLILLEGCKEQLCEEFMSCVNECVKGVCVRDALENSIVETRTGHVNGIDS